MARKLEANLSGRHLCVAIPAGDGKVLANQAVALAHLSNKLTHHGVTLSVQICSGCSLVTKARNILVKEVLNTEGVTDVLFLDNDIQFGSDDVIRLMVWLAAKEFVAGVYRAKSDPVIFYTAPTLSDGKLAQCPETGLVPHESVPGGFIMMRREALARMHDWYAEECGYGTRDGGREVALFDTALKNGSYYGEDIVFCHRWRAMGGEIFVDPEIELTHVGGGSFCYNYGDYLLNGGAET